MMWVNDLEENEKEEIRKQMFGSLHGHRLIR